MSIRPAVRYVFLGIVVIGTIAIPATLAHKALQVLTTAPTAPLPKEVEIVAPVHTPDETPVKKVEFDPTIPSEKDWVEVDEHGNPVSKSEQEEDETLSAEAEDESNPETETAEASKETSPESTPKETPAVVSQPAIVERAPAPQAPAPAPAPAPVVVTPKPAPAPTPVVAAPKPAPAPKPIVTQPSAPARVETAQPINNVRQVGKTTCKVDGAGRGRVKKKNLRCN